MPSVTINSRYRRSLCCCSLLHRMSLPLLLLLHTDPTVTIFAFVVAVPAPAPLSLLSPTAAAAPAASPAAALLSTPLQRHLFCGRAPDCQRLPRQRPCAIVTHIAIPSADVPHATFPRADDKNNFFPCFVFRCPAVCRDTTRRDAARCDAVCWNARCTDARCAIIHSPQSRPIRCHLPPFHSPRYHLL